MEEVVIMSSSQQDKLAFLKAKETTYLCNIAQNMISGTFLRRPFKKLKCRTGILRLPESVVQKTVA